MITAVNAPASTPASRASALAIFAVELAHDVINYARPNEPLGMGMGGWQSFRADFPETTAAERKLFEDTFDATLAKFAHFSEGVLCNVVMTLPNSD